MPGGVKKSIFSDILAFDRYSIIAFPNSTWRRKMPSLADSIKAVKNTLDDDDYARQSHEATQRQHERILDEYDRMTQHRSSRIKDERRHDRERRSGRSSDRKRRDDEDKAPSSMRFRFKDGKDSKSERKRHRSHRHRHASVDGDGGNLDPYAAHPLPRPRRSDYLDPSMSTSPPPEENTAKASLGPDEAFRQSLFDAIADDEGAAYWEGVYSQPIHVYPRPSTVNAQGELEQMSDDQYVDYVKTKMWERKHPELARQQEARAEEAAKKRKRPVDDEEEEWEWIGNEEKGYERRYAGSRPRTRPKAQDSSFQSDINAALARGAKRKQSKQYQQSWSTYHDRWQALLTQRPQNLLDAIPWPVLSLHANDVSKDAIVEFFAHATEDKIKLLKAQRVQWHPDKIQQMAGSVDDERMRLVTLVFQTIDELFVKERGMQ